jgi:hypothetical protein
MPITTFKSFADTLHDGQMSHGHFIAKTKPGRRTPLGAIRERRLVPTLLV